MDVAVVAPPSGYSKDSGATAGLLGTLAAARGVVVRQESQWLAAVLGSEGVPYESQNKYHVREAAPTPCGHNVACCVHTLSREPA